MVNGDNETTAPTGPIGRTRSEELQALLATQAAVPAVPARTSTPPPAPPSEPTAMSRAMGDVFSERVKKYMREEIESALAPLKDVLSGLKAQVAVLVDRMDEAGRKDDGHDGELVGLKKGLEEAEEAIKNAQTAADAAQTAADVVNQRLTDELGSF